MNPNELLAQQLRPFEEKARGMSGWVLEYQPTPVSSGPPWSYEARAAALLAEATSVLDLGTGGGEVLKRLTVDYAGFAVAAEQYYLNAPVASENLNGVADVVRCDSNILPFADRSFDLVLSRHTALSPNEVGRVVREGGRFLTQQIIPDYLSELSSYFPDMNIYSNHFEQYCEGLKKAGFCIRDAREFRTLARFEELGHLVYLLVAAPWTVPGFSVDTHLKNLQSLQRLIALGQPLEFTTGYCVIEGEYCI
ncbi:MAG: SAM-dependent methyltransferase [Candidatus Azotimanducaceae bacterium]|jgi:SAM-dependent methyltransferase